MKISKRPDHTTPLFFKRTVAAQTHLLGFFAAVMGLVVLIPHVRASGSIHIWGAFAFGLTAALVFGVSSVYHFLHDGFQMCNRSQNLFEHLDQFSIYLFIAGTYTPFLLNAVKSPWKEILIVAIWSMAIFGIIYTSIRHRLPTWAQSRYVYTGVFVLMGWTLLARLGEVWTHLSERGLVFLMGGAAAYSVGALVYAFKRPRLFEGVFGFHEVWHLLVVAGFAFHYALIYSFYV